MLGKDIKELVIVKMEEHTPYGPTSGAPLLAGGDSVAQVKPVDSYSDKSLAEAADEMLSIIPLRYLIFKTASVEGVPDEDDNRIGTIQLPGDFLRLHTLRMAGWTKPVHVAIDESHPAYDWQSSVFTRGTKQKPVVTIGNYSSAEENMDGTMFDERNMRLNSASILDNNGYVTIYADVDAQGYVHFLSGRLHYYSVDAGTAHEVKEFKYIPRFDLDMNYDRRVAEVIALHCARKIYEVYGNLEQAKAMTEEINSVLENLRQ